jgi:hypothetical protein
LLRAGACLFSEMGNGPYQLSGYRTAPGKPATLGDQLASQSSKWLWVYCSSNNCAHKAAVPLAPFAIRWGRDVTIEEFRKRLRCSRCGGRGAQTIVPSVDLRINDVQEFPLDDGLRVLDDDAWLNRMCNLYSLQTSRQAVAQVFRLSDNRMGDVPSLPAIFPGHAAPVVRIADDGERELRGA